MLGIVGNSYKKSHLEGMVCLLDGPHSSPELTDQVSWQMLGRQSPHVPHGEGTYRRKVGTFHWHRTNLITCDFKYNALLCCSHLNHALRKPFQSFIWKSQIIRTKREVDSSNEPRFIKYFHQNKRFLGNKFMKIHLNRSLNCSR